jgi:hypothetical protein
MRRILVGACCVVLALAAAGDDERLVTDEDLRYRGESLDDANVTMSCRFGTWVEDFEHGIFKPEDYAMFVTKDEEVEVIVPRARKAVLDTLKQVKAGTEISVKGKVHWAEGVRAYVVIHEWKRGYSQPYDPERKVKAEEIELSFGGKVYLMEKGKSYTLTTPKGEKVEASWDVK